MKFLASRKKLFLEILSVLIVYAFIATSFVPYIGHSDNSTYTKSIFGVNSNPPVSGNSNSSYPNYVKCTLELLNNKLVKGYSIRI